MVLNFCRSVYIYIYILRCFIRIFIYINNAFCLGFNRIDCVMVSVLASSAVDRGFEPVTKEKEQRLVGSYSGECVRVGRHVYRQTVVSVS